MVTTTVRHVTAGEAGKMLGVGPQRVRDMVDAGQLPAERTASGIRLIPLAAVQKLVEERSDAGRARSGR